jgi:hypothetical protein
LDFGFGRAERFVAVTVVVLAVFVVFGSVGLVAPGKGGIEKLVERLAPGVPAEVFVVFVVVLAAA